MNETEAVSPPIEESAERANPPVLLWVLCGVLVAALAVAYRGVWPYWSGARTSTPTAGI